MLEIVKLVLIMSLMASSAVVSAAGEAGKKAIVKWVDDNGTTHFGNRQFGHNQNAEELKVAPANRMAVPVSPPGNSAGKAAFVKIKKAPKVNKNRLQKRASYMKGGRNSSNRRGGRNRRNR